jgi:AraC family transcriptional regulator
MHHSLGEEFRLSAGSELAAATVRLEYFEGPEHVHPETQVAILLSGSAATFTRRSIFSSVTSPVVPGSFVYIPSGEPHRTRWHGTTELLNIYWGGDFLRELADRHGCSLVERPLTYRVDSAIPSIGHILMDEYLWSGSLSLMTIDHARALVASRLFQLTNERSKRSSTGLLSKKKLQSAIDALHASPERSFTLKELAELCHSSIFHFSRSFTAHCGSAPFAYLRHLRVQKARDLLSSTELSVDSVSTAVGMENAKSFSRVFRRATGWSPRDYRRMMMRTSEKPS